MLGPIMPLPPIRCGAAFVSPWSVRLGSFIIINTRISRRVTIVTWCHNCNAVCHNCDILFVKMLELGSEIIPKN